MKIRNASPDLNEALDKEKKINNEFQSHVTYQSYIGQE